MAGRRAVLVGGALALAGCSVPGRGERPAGRVVLSTGSPRGVYYAWGTALAEQVGRDHPALTVTVAESSGSVENLTRIATGTHDLGITTEDAADDAVGTPGGLVALARIYDDYVHVVVRADGELRTLADLRGLPVAVGQPGSGVALVTRRVLEQAGVVVQGREIDLVVGTRALEEGFVDAVFWSGGLPTAAIADLAGRVPVRLLPLDSVASPLRSRHGVAYRPATVPPGVYGIPEPVPTVASANLLVCRPSADGGVVRALLETMFLRRDAIAAAAPAGNALDRRTAINTGLLDLHPAAAAWYRAVKP